MEMQQLVAQYERAKCSRFVFPPPRRILDILGSAFAFKLNRFIGKKRVKNCNQTMLDYIIFRVIENWSINIINKALHC